MTGSVNSGAKNGTTIQIGRREPVLKKADQPAAATVARRCSSESAACARRALCASRSQSAKLAARDKIVLEHLNLVKAIALRLHDSLPVHVDTDDLIHAGVLGLIDAASKFSTDKQVSFASYAKYRIKGAILDSLRQMDWASRDLRRRHKQLDVATRALTSELYRAPTEAEIAERLGFDIERWRHMVVELRNTGLISANTRTTEHEDLPEPDYPATPDTQPDKICARSQMKSALNQAMTCLPDRYRQVVDLYYTNEMTMKEIGGILGINESRVSQIHKASLAKMEVSLQEVGIHSAGAF